MKQLSTLIDWYAFGLLVYMLLSKPKYREGARVKRWLEALYSPLLVPARAIVKPIVAGSSTMDVSAPLVFLAVMVTRALLRYWIGD